MLQPRMFTSLARLSNKIKTMGLDRKLQQAVNSKMPPVISTCDDTALEIATSLILDGKVIALPTDTIYGIAVSAQNNDGINNLYEIKKRDIAKPIGICVGSISDVSLFGETSHLPTDLLESLLPGPVTIVLKRKNKLNPLLNPNTDLIGIRIPKCSFIQNLANLCGSPLALTSANLSSETSPLEVSEFEHLWPYLGGVFNGGRLGSTLSSRAGSTVIDLSEFGHFKILRPGSALESTLATVKKFELKQKN